VNFFLLKRSVFHHITFENSCHIGYTNLVQSTSITAMVTVCNVLSDDMDVLHKCLSRITITNSEK